MGPEVGYRWLLTGVQSWLINFRHKLTGLIWMCVVWFDCLCFYYRKYLFACLWCKVPTWNPKMDSTKSMLNRLFGWTGARRNLSVEHGHVWGFWRGTFRTLVFCQWYHESSWHTANAACFFLGLLCLHCFVCIFFVFCGLEIDMVTLQYASIHDVLFYNILYIIYIIHIV